MGKNFFEGYQSSIRIATYNSKEKSKEASMCEKIINSISFK